jgi:hypothetical protein
MAFVGALLTMSISLILPALMHLRLLGQLHPQHQPAAAAAGSPQGKDCAECIKGRATEGMAETSAGGSGSGQLQGAAAAAAGPAEGATGQSGAPGSVGTATSGSGRVRAPWLLLCLDVAVVLLGVGCAYVGASSAAASLQQKLMV